MHTLFDDDARRAILKRLETLQAGSVRQWGKMDPAQMLAHCAIALEMATGEKPLKQKLIGKLLGPLVRGSILGEKPFSRNSPTDPTFIVSDPRDFAAEKARLIGVVGRFCEKGPAEAARQTHAFLGRMTGEEWGVMMFKHLDHHLRQFGV